MTEKGIAKPKKAVPKGTTKEKPDEELTDAEVLKKLFPKEARKIIRPPAKRARRS